MKDVTGLDPVTFSDVKNLGKAEPSVSQFRAKPRVPKVRKTRMVKKLRLISFVEPFRRGF